MTEAAKDAPADADKALYTRVMDEISTAQKAPGYKKWITRAEKIVKRYRDERQDTDSGDGDEPRGAKFNILWSNVQTLQPALFSKPPKAVVERRYLDRDPVGRLASVIMERSLSYEIDSGAFDATIRRVVLDRLLPGRGVAWVRYEPTFRAMPSKTTDPEAMAEQPSEPEEEKVYECTGLDYVDYRDFLTAPVRVWEENPWISRCVRMSRKELVARFGEDKGNRVKLDWSPYSDKDGKPDIGTPEEEKSKRAIVYEFWDKPERQVVWVSPGLKDETLDRKDDPLRLEGFWPTPKPLSATLTNDSLIPVPDYYEYQDQARELDDLTARINALTHAIKAAGVYDASVKELERMLQEDFENRLVPCDNWAQFSEKMGASGVGGIWMLPIKDMAAVLIQLYQAREQVKQVLYEITGISDIVRGQAAAGPAATATEQRIKGQFASLRLNEMQGEVARYVRDCLRIMGEIIAEHFSPMTLWLISGYEQYAQDQRVGQPAPQPPQMGHNGGPQMAPEMGAPPPMAMAGMQPQQAPDRAQEDKDKFVKAVQLLKDERQRGFRIDIENKSMIEPDQQEQKQAVVELMGALANFLPQALELGMQQPALTPVMGKIMLASIRRFEFGRDIESVLEQAVDDMDKAAANPEPKPPSPEEIKLQGEMKKQEMESQRMQMQAQIDQQKGEQELQMAQAKNAMEIERMQAELAIKQQELALKREELAMKQEQMQVDAMIKQQTAQADLAVTERKSQIEGDAMERQAAVDAEAAERSAEIGETQHTQQLEVMDAKSKQALAAAKKPKEAGK